MDFTQYTWLKNQFASSPNLCNLFKLLSYETWKRIEYAYLKPGIKVYETTITQNLLFTINAYNDQYGLNIDIYEATDENTNGNDIELVIKYPSSNRIFYAPIQAKKIYRNGKYWSMDHGDQIESLQSYAAARNAKPLYLLYNFTEDSSHGLTPEDAGCTIVSANYLHDNFYKEKTRRDGSTYKGWNIPNFLNLHPAPAFSWHKLVCPNSSYDLHEYLRSKRLVSDFSLKHPIRVFLDMEYAEGFLRLDSINFDGWVNIKESIPKAFSDPSSKEIYSDDIKRENGKNQGRAYPDFSPQKRIVISQTSTNDKR